MNIMLTLAIIGAFTIAGGSALAADAPAKTTTTAQAATPAAAPPATPPAPNAQQERMKACNTKAADKKGDERKAFMSTCLAGKDAPEAKMTQQEKMKACNAKAGDKKGDERKAFMSNCLKAAPPA